MKRFGYWRDPLFVSTSLLYAVNRWLIMPHVHSPFMRGHFNDCLLIPCALPLVLWLQRQLGLRKHDLFPESGEIFFHLAVWSIVCEVIGPRIAHVTGDPWDVLCYFAGGLVAGLWWWRYSRMSPGRA